MERGEVGGLGLSMRETSFTSNFDADLDKILYTLWVVLIISKALSGFNFLGF